MYRISLSLDQDTDILYLNVAGQSIVVLDTAEAVTELLEKRSSVYSSRSVSILILRPTFSLSHSARMPMINELMGWNFNFGFMKYGR